MNLRKVAAKFETTQFEAYDEALESWAPNAFTGKVFPIDRFLSNFNRPTRRRFLGVSPTAILPVSNTIRVPATGEIYFIGELREDSRAGISYEQLGILHRSDNTLGTINRKLPAGPSNDPGWLVAQTPVKHFIDVELRSAAEADERVDDFEGSYFVILPSHADIQEWDQITVSGENYMVELPYVDSGFNFARALKRPDQRQDFVYYYRGAALSYDTSTRVLTEGFVNYNVTGFATDFSLGAIDFSSVKAGDIKIIIKQAHIGIMPAAEDELLWDGQRYKVQTVRQDFLKEQYQLHCTL